MDNEKKQRFERKPNFDVGAKLSRDGRYWIITRTETWILPRKYFDVISENHVREAPHALPEPENTKPKQKGKRNADSNG